VSAYARRPTREGAVVSLARWATRHAARALDVKTEADAAFQHGWRLGVFKVLENVQDQMTAIRELAVKQAEQYRAACVEAEKAGESARACVTCGKPRGAHFKSEQGLRCADDATSQIYEETSAEPAYEPPPPPVYPRMEYSLAELRLMVERILADAPAHEPSGPRL
jgi:hypothetical protein